MALFFYQLKQACLSLQKSMVFAVSVIVTIGVTLGALICALTLAYVTLVKPLPYPEQDKLVHIEHQLIDHNGAVDGRAFTYPNLMHLYQHQQVFEQGALIYRDGDVLTSIATEPMIAISYVSPEWFSIFAPTLAMGRGFDDNEQLTRFNPVAVISHDMWVEVFQQASDILQKTLTFGGNSYQIVGVIAPNFNEPQIAGSAFKTQVYLPWDFNSISEDDRHAWGNDDGNLSYIGQLKKTAALTPISEQLTSLISNNWQQQVAGQPFFKNWRIGIEATSLRDYIVADSAQQIILLVIGALGLVIIACTNIANLFVARTAQRQKLLAIMAAVGASRRKLYATLIAETSVLIFISLLVALALANIGFWAMTHFLQADFPRLNELGANGFFMVISITLAVILTFAFSTLSLRMINYRALNTSLQSSGKGNGVQVSKRIRQLLISCQIAIATLLVFINLVLFQDARDILSQSLGFQTDDRYAVVLALPANDQQLNAELLARLKQELLAEPKIVAISQAMRPSLFNILAITVAETQQRFTARGKDIDNNYFTLIDQKLVAGRMFTSDDIKNREKVIIINDVFAKQLAPDGNALGVTFDNGAQVVGIVESIILPGQRQTDSRFYYPASLARNMLLLKVAEHQQLSREQIVALLKRTDSQLKLFSFSSLNTYKAQRLFSATITAYTTLILVLLTFLLSALGLYGILHFSSQMRRFEIGTRLAIGAKRKDIVTLIVKDNLIALGSGLVISVTVLLTAYVIFTPQMSQFISQGVGVVFLATVALILIVALTACYLPLRKYLSRPAVYSLKGAQ